MWAVEKVTFGRLCLSQKDSESKVLAALEIIINHQSSFRVLRCLYGRGMVMLDFKNKLISKSKHGLSTSYKLKLGPGSIPSLWLRNSKFLKTSAGRKQLLLQASETETTMAAPSSHFFCSLSTYLMSHARLRETTLVFTVIQYEWFRREYHWS